MGFWPIFLSLGYGSPPATTIDYTTPTMLCIMSGDE